LSTAPRNDLAVAPTTSPETRLSRRWRGRFIRSAGIAIAVLALLGWQFYPAGLRWLGEFLVKGDKPEPADAVLVVGGDFWGPRVIQGAELGVHRFAPRVLISGPPYRDRPESQLAIEFLVQKGYPKSLFVSLPIYGKSTIEEAIELAPQLRKLNIHRAILVTRNSHSRRASIVFRLFCPGVRFQSVPAVDEFQARRWWNDHASEQLFRSEWLKIVGTIVIKYPAYLADRAFR